MVYTDLGVDFRHRHENRNNDDLYMNLSQTLEHLRKEREEEQRAREQRTEDAQPTGYEEEELSMPHKQERPFDDSRFGMELEEESFPVGEDGATQYPQEYTLPSTPAITTISVPSYFFGVGTNVRPF